jgi:hypothetical protein
MKIKFIILSLLLIASLSAYSQVKPKEHKPKHSYRKVIVVEVQDFNTLTEALQQWKRLSMYDPQKKAEQKVQDYQLIEQYASTFMSRIKVDSVKISIDTIPKPKK